MKTWFDTCHPSIQKKELHPREKSIIIPKLAQKPHRGREYEEPKTPSVKHKAKKTLRARAREKYTVLQSKQRPGLCSSRIKIISNKTAHQELKSGELRTTNRITRKNRECGYGPCSPTQCRESDRGGGRQRKEDDFDIEVTVGYIHVNRED
jgi:hypothetical protein